MLKAKHNFIIYPFFQFYTLWKLKRKFEKVEIFGKIEPKNKAVLLLSNHVSWWDGFWAMYLKLKILPRKFHFMMLEDQLKKYKFFNYTGGFSINKNSSSVISTLKYTAKLLEDDKNLVLIFPQGKIQSMHLQDFKFEKGVQTILNITNTEVQIVFTVNIIDYFSEAKPSLYMYVNEYEGENYKIETLEKSYNKFYQNVIKNHIKKSE